MKFNKILFLFFIILSLCRINTLAQTKHEIGIVNDNDLYVSISLDEFYTNGLELFYKKLTTPKYSFFDKKISKYTIEQNIYNPQESDIPLVFIQERPYAGYLNINYSEQLINTKNIFTWGLSVGVTHDKSGAESAQNFIHKFYNIEPSEGWDTQIKEKHAFGILASYNRSLLYKENLQLDLLYINSINLNNIFTNISNGLAFRINFLSTPLAPIFNSTFLGTALQNKNENWVKEVYFGVKSSATYQIQDYTITGDLEENPSDKEFNLEPWTWQNDIGFYWNLENTNFSYHIIYKTREATEMTTKITKYGSIQFSYKF